MSRAVQVRVIEVRPRKSTVKFVEDQLRIYKQRTQIEDLSEAEKKHMERIAAVIQATIEQLPDEKQKLIELKYWTDPRKMEISWDLISMQLHVSARQAQRWRDEIICKIAKEMGWR